MYNVRDIKKGFPIFDTYPDLVYLDSAATSQKPKEVIEAVSNFYTQKNANIHRGIYKLAELATEVYENARIQVAEFINARNSKEIIFTENTNQSINFAAYGWARKFLKKGDIIVLSEMEHHANIVPWIRLKEEKDVELLFLPINKEFRLDYQIISERFAAGYPPSQMLRRTSKPAPAKNILRGRNFIDMERIKLVALTNASNVLGTINPLKEIVAYFRKNTKAKILIDAAQYIPHMQIDVQNLNIDFLGFSSHKMFGPSGVGVLWAKENLLDIMEPFFTGSNMINMVTKTNFTYADLPAKFESGTGNLEGVAGLSAALTYIRKIGYENIIKHERELATYCLEKLKKIKYLELYGPADIENRLAIFSFNITDAHPHDVSQIFDSQNIAIRAGHHCSQILMKSLGVPATARASFYVYNTKDDIDRLIEGIKKVKEVLRI